MIGWQGGIVPTRETRKAVGRMLHIARRESGPVAVLEVLDDVPQDQWPALIAALLNRERQRLGQPTKPLTLSPAERKAAHARWVAGHTDDATRLGEREYQRAWARAKRERMTG